LLHFVEQEADFLSGPEVGSVLLGRLNELWLAIWPQGNIVDILRATFPPLSLTNEQIQGEGDPRKILIKLK